MRRSISTLRNLWKQLPTGTLVPSCALGERMNQRCPPRPLTSQKSDPGRREPRAHVTPPLGRKGPVSRRQEREQGLQAGGTADWTGSRGQRDREYKL